MSTTRIKFQFFGFWDVIFALKKAPPEVVVSVGSGTIQVFDGLLLGSTRASWLLQALCRTCHHQFEYQASIKARWLDKNQAETSGAEK